jgi:hypothetical protein
VPGEHWVYRIDRTNHRRCWFLASGGTDARSRFGRTKLATQRNEAEITKDTPRLQSAPADPNVSPATTGPQTAISEQPLAPQITSASLKPASQALAPVTVPTISYKQISPEVPVHADRKRATSAINWNFLADVAATILLLTGGVLYLAARMVRYRGPGASHDARKTAVDRVPTIRSPSLAVELPTASEILEKIRIQSRTPS